MEHWLPLFHDGWRRCSTICRRRRSRLDHQVDEAIEARLELIADYYDARLNDRQPKGGMSGGADYRPLPPERLYLDADGMGTAARRPQRRCQPSPLRLRRPGGGRHGRSRRAPATRFRRGAHSPDVNLFDAVADARDGSARGRAAGR